MRVFTAVALCAALLSCLAAGCKKDKAEDASKAGAAGGGKAGGQMQTAPKAE